MVLSLEIQDILILKDSLESLDVLLNIKKPMMPGFSVSICQSELGVQNRWFNQQLFTENSVYNVKHLLLLLARYPERFNLHRILVFGRYLVHYFDYIADTKVDVNILVIIWDCTQRRIYLVGAF